MIGIDGSLRLRRTRQGYVAVLRLQSADGERVQIAGRCSHREARELALMGADEVGFSFRNAARKIARAGSRLAKSRVLKGIVKLAKFAPAPIGTAAMAASEAARVIRGMRAGSRGAHAAWTDAARRARIAPHGSTAVGMRLAMAAEGRPTFRAPPPASPRSSSARDARMTAELRALRRGMAMMRGQLAELGELAELAAQPEAAAPAPEPPPTPAPAAAAEATP